jgi:hypothetical protein
LKYYPSPPINLLSKPPIGIELPNKSISPVNATVFLTGILHNLDTNAKQNAKLALGPSFDVDKSGQ